MFIAGVHSENLKNSQSSKGIPLVVWFFVRSEKPVSLPTICFSSSTNLLALFCPVFLSFKKMQSFVRSSPRRNQNTSTQQTTICFFWFLNRHMFAPIRLYRKTKTWNNFFLKHCYGRILTTNTRTRLFKRSLVLTIRCWTSWSSVSGFFVFFEPEVLK